jgi:hypothetical protein
MPLHKVLSDYRRKEYMRGIYAVKLATRFCSDFVTSDS